MYKNDTTLAQEVQQNNHPPALESEKAISVDMIIAISDETIPKAEELKVEGATTAQIPETQDNEVAEIQPESPPEDVVDQSKASEALPSPKPPTYRIAEDEGMEIAKPLCLLKGKAYAVTWQTVEKITTEKLDPDGKIVKLDPPEITSETKPIVVRSDGTTYGYLTPIEFLGIKIHLREKIKPEHNWSPKGLKRFMNKKYPDPVVVFEQIIKVVDRFIDFYKSLADQRTMCELIACWILATWFNDAFSVTGYLWITGCRGSGKTNLLVIISQLSYLGSLISQSGSFASLRDMADYGATLAYDDAENITDPKKTDPDKMALLLAGNRKPITVPVKEMGTDRNWHTRHVNAYCSRAFTAIRVPDATMASRTIILPMLRTPNKSKGNTDPMDYENWPLDRRDLTDELWALALQKLPLLPEWDRSVGKKAKLIGRNFQPWRSVLAVAAWLEKCGVEGLYERMVTLSLAYQKERSELEIADVTRVVIQALCNCAINAINANKNVKQVNVSVQDVTDSLKKIIEEEELDLDSNYMNNKKVGRILAKFRFPETPRQGNKGSRLRAIDLNDLADLAESYNIDFLNRLLGNGKTITQHLNSNGTNGTNGVDGSNSTDDINGTNGTNGTQEVALPLLDDKFDHNEPPPHSCNMCGYSKFWQRPDGGWVCSICHPSPDKIAAQQLPQSTPPLPMPAQVKYISDKRISISLAESLS